MQSVGVRPEIELFDSGDIAILHHLISEGVVPADPLCSIVMGVNYGFRPSPETLLYARSQLPTAATWTGFATGKWAFPMVAQSAIAGGNLRIGMEDAAYMNRGVKAPSNAAMVSKAARMAKDLGVELLTAAQTRENLNLQKSSES
nr:3-keto-5-aminohexanoate cleavage protein [Yoonia sp. I 8.24]